MKTENSEPQAYPPSKEYSHKSQSLIQVGESQQEKGAVKLPVK